MRKYLYYKNKTRLVLLILFQTLRTFGTVGVAILINYLIDSVSMAITSGQISALVRCAGICCAYALLLGLVILVGEKMKALGIKHIMLHIREKILNGILNKNISELQNTNSAEYITLLNQNLSVFEENYLKNLLSIYESLVGILIAVVLLIYINPIIAVISIIAMTIPSLIPKLFGNRLGKLQGDIMQCAADYNVKIKDILNGCEVIKAYHIDDIIGKKHNEAAAKLEQSKVSSADAMAWLYGLANMASISVQFLIMTLCGVFAVRGFITIGSIIAVTQLTGQVISPAFQLSAKFSQLKAMKPICDQIQAVVQSSQCAENVSGTKEMERSLKLEDLSFSYGDTPVIKNIKAQFDSGKKYAIVGKSGSGKSTLLKILAGYYKDYTGTVDVDGVMNQSCSLSLISQNIFLFDDSVRNNITLYREYSADALDRVIRMAGLRETIDRLEEGLDTKVEENGSRFSGGEKQRIAIARALLHNKSVLLLDEATSSLDNECAREIEESLLELKNVTSIAVTHKLYSNVLQKYDKIFVMDDGRIVEQGTFQELMENSGIFQKLYSAGAA
ncbi:MAG: ABC transporter ATP-binding protein/permease [Butyrivibrio sp.]|nr:ABC transporter ATP-binding protein/permease [Acetatifactor muris]MCM1559903.1 ABC transporter ATP-binding protein/permease [Butyrivibrio sp.]